jgi:hypothetical protein
MSQIIGPQLFEFRFDNRLFVLVFMGCQEATAHFLVSEHLKRSFYFANLPMEQTFFCRSALVQFGNPSVNSLHL